jgi:predicted MFS family arabinose efflux permease
VWTSSEYGWRSPQTVALYATGVVAAIAFVRWEHRAAEPVLPLRVFRRQGFAPSVAISFVAGAAMFGAIVYLPLFLQAVQGKEATNAGLLLLPLMMALMAASLITGRLTTRTGRYRLYPIVGTAVASVGLWLFSTMEPDTSRTTSTAFMIVLGFGIGTALPVTTLAAQNTVEMRDLGAGTASVNFFRTLSTPQSVSRSSA